MINKVIGVFIIILAASYVMTAQIASLQQLKGSDVEAQANSSDLFLHPTFEYCSIYQLDNSERSDYRGYINQLRYNINRETNQVYLIDEAGTAHVVNPQDIHRIYTKVGNDYIKMNPNFPDKFCEVIYYGEGMNVYKLDGKTYAIKSGNHIEIELTQEAIVDLYGVSEERTAKVAAENLDFNNTNDQQTILRIFEMGR